jgi:hypothetical protein
VKGDHLTRRQSYLRPSATRRNGAPGAPESAGAGHRPDQEATIAPVAWLALASPHRASCREHRGPGGTARAQSDSAVTRTHAAPAAASHPVPSGQTSRFLRSNVRSGGDPMRGFELGAAARFHQPWHTMHTTAARRTKRHIPCGVKKFCPGWSLAVVALRPPLRGDAAGSVVRRSLTTPPDATSAFA